MQPFMGPPGDEWIEDDDDIQVDLSAVVQALKNHVQADRNYTDEESLIVLIYTCGEHFNWSIAKQLKGWDSADCIRAFVDAIASDLIDANTLQLTHRGSMVARAIMCEG